MRALHLHRHRHAAVAAIAFSVFSASVLAPALARADDEADRGQARDLGTKAYAASQQGDWAKAEDLFRRADALFHAPTLLLGLARARAHLGKYVESWEDYHRILIEPLPANAGPALKKAVEDAKTEITSVEGKRARATISVTGAPNPVVTLDGAPVSVAGLGNERAVNPGAHAVHVEAQGFKPADTTFTVAEGASATASVTMVPDPGATAAPSAPTPAPATATPPSPASGAAPAADTGDSGSTRRTLGIVGMGVGGAGIVVGAITGIVAMSQHSSLQSNACANAGCGPSDLANYNSSVSSYQTMGTVSTISFIAGGVLAAGGAVLFFTAPLGEAAPSPAAAFIQPYVGLGSAGAFGRF